MLQLHVPGPSQTSPLALPDTVNVPAAVGTAVTVMLVEPARSSVPTRQSRIPPAAAQPGALVTPSSAGTDASTWMSVTGSCRIVPMPIVNVTGSPTATVEGE